MGKSINSQVLIFHEAFKFKGYGSLPLWNIKSIQGLFKTRVQSMELGMNVHENGNIWDWISNND